jgi:uncharacterized protein (TIGR02300 family)
LLLTIIGRSLYGRPPDGERGAIVVKAELGTKRHCPNCGARYYDLNRSPIICPRCGTEFEVVSTRARPPAAATAVVEEVVEKVEVEAEADTGPEVVSLEEADSEAAESGAVAIEVDDDEDDIDAEGDDTFLAEDEEEDDEDVGDIIGDVDEDDT